MLKYQARLVALHATASQLRLGQMVALGVMVLAVLAIILLAFFSIAKHSVRLPLRFVLAFCSFSRFAMVTFRMADDTRSISTLRLGSC